MIQGTPQPASFRGKDASDPGAAEAKLFIVCLLVCFLFGLAWFCVTPARTLRQSPLLCYAALPCHITSCQCRVHVRYLMLLCVNTKLMHHCCNQGVHPPRPVPGPPSLVGTVFQPHQPSPSPHLQVSDMLPRPPGRLRPTSTWLTSSHSSCVRTNTNAPTVRSHNSQHFPSCKLHGHEYVLPGSRPPGVSPFQLVSHLQPCPLLETQCIAHGRDFKNLICG